MTDETIIRFDPPATGGGGGGTPLAGGLGIGLDTITNPGTTIINNTGTIVQPTTNNSVSSGVLLQSGDVATFAGTGFAVSGGVYFHVGKVTVSDTAAATASAGGVLFLGGSAYFNSAYRAAGGISQLSGGYGDPINSSGGGVLFRAGGADATGVANAYGGSLDFYSGNASGGTVTNVGGGIVFGAGNGNQKGGDVSLTPGSGASNGVLLVHNIGTIDPHVLDAKFQVSVAGVGFVGVYSKG